MAEGHGSPHDDTHTTSADKSIAAVSGTGTGAAAEAANQAGRAWLLADYALPAGLAQVRLAGLIDLVTNGEIPKDSNVLYAHLGGQPALNAYSSIFSAERQAPAVK